MTPATPFELECPLCRSAVKVEENSGLCESNGHRFRCAAGIWRFLPLARELRFKDFLRDYKIVRTSEGWGSPKAEYYRSLPRVGRGDPQRGIWRIREMNFRYLLGWIGSPKGLRILDLGAGNGWLSYQMARRGHQAAAVDLSDDPRDGLGAWIQYDKQFECYQAEFDCLPFRAAQFDLVIFNASLHYSIELDRTVCEAGQVLKPQGKITVLDSPFYSNPSAGEAMLAERESAFHAKFGFNRKVGEIGFLTEDALRRAANSGGLTLELHFTDEAWDQRLRRDWARRRTGRETARFPVMTMEKR